MKIRIHTSNNWPIVLAVTLLTLFSYTLDFIGIVFPGAVLMLSVIGLLFWWIFVKGKNLIILSSPSLICYFLLIIIDVLSTVANGWDISSFNLRYIAIFFIPLFFLFFYGGLDEDYKIDRMLSIIDVVFWISFGLFLIQQLFMGFTHQDYLSGVFGTTMGNDGFTNIFLCIALIYVLVSYTHKKKSLKYLICVVLASLYQAIVGEIKVYFFELLLIVLIVYMFEKPSLKSFVAIIGVVAGVSISVYILGLVYPYFKDFFTLSNMIELIGSDKGYTGVGDINRLNGVSILKSLCENDFQVWFGHGLGSAYNTSDFYLRYSYLHFNWFSHTYIFTEVGILGLAVTMFGFVFEAVKCIYGAVKEEDENLKIYFKMSAIICLLMPLLFIYNIKLLTEIGALMISLFVALPYAYIKNNKE